MTTNYRLGIDAGGTFTDFVIADKTTGVTKLFKALSTPSNPTLAIENGLKLISEDLGLSPKEVVSNCDLCINGTPVGLNALITHRGGKTGLICTAGHEDSIEIRNGHKEDGFRYDPEYPAAVMLAPRYLRKGVRERVLSDGSVRTPLHEDDVRAACEAFKEEGVETAAISFVWSVLNPAHERRAAEIVREMLPNVILTVGSELYPQVREYTRTSTSVVNAYLAPVMRSYVEAVDAYFKSLGAKQPVRYFQSNGGLAVGSVMTDRSVYAINSGPASAPQAGLYVCAPFKKKNVITVDMGGTSFDITLTKDGQTNLNKNIDFLRYRIGVPMIQVETLGAGGGSIGWIDSLGILTVGPLSAGSQPGPACYNQGGLEPTISDANLVLGYLSPDGLLGGRLPLDLEKARAAIKTIADPLHLTMEQAGYGMFTIVNNNMVNGISSRLRRAGVRSARLRAGRRGRGDRSAHHGVGARDRGRDDHSAQARLRTLRLWSDHLGRKIQLHGDGARPPRQRGVLQAYRSAFQIDRGEGRQASERRRVREKQDSGSAQPRHAVRWPGARMHRRYRHVQYQRDDDRSHQGRVPSPA